MDRMSTSSLTCAEDIDVGVPFDQGQYIVSKDPIVEFARSWDPLSLHTDLAAAGQDRLAV
jgi:acyl dehydratase